MNRKPALIILAVAAIALGVLIGAMLSSKADATAETLVDQGKPGAYGAWPVTFTGTLTTTGSVTVTNPVSTVTVSNTVTTTSPGYSFRTNRETEVICSTSSSTITLLPGQRYAITVTEESPVRILDCNQCTSYAAGPGMLITKDTMLDFTASSCPDGGVPVYSCCAQTPVAGGPILGATPIF